jgi:hypothetical protein
LSGRTTLLACGLFCGFNGRRFDSLVEPAFIACLIVSDCLTRGRGGQSYQSHESYFSPLGTEELDAIAGGVSGNQRKRPAASPMPPDAPAQPPIHSNHFRIGCAWPGVLPRAMLLPASCYANYKSNDPKPVASHRPSISSRAKRPQRNEPKRQLLSPRLINPIPPRRQSEPHCE